MPGMAQEMWGLVSGNYAGINAAHLNPSSMLHSRLYLDVNVATAELFLENNAFYIHREDFKPVSFLRSSDNLPEYGKDELPFDYYLNQDRKNIHVNALVQGPSFSMVRGEQAFGFSMAFRSVFSGRSIPYEVIPFSYEGLNYSSLHNINFDEDGMLISGMAWLETGLSYARSIYRRGPESFSTGISLKYLKGMGGSYLDLQHLNYIVNNDSTLNIKNIDGQFGFAPADYSAGRLFNGSGFSMDLGITFVKMKRNYSLRKREKMCKQQFEEYFYKLGISLVDLGGIRFSKDAQLHDYEEVSQFWEQVDTVNFRGLDPFTNMLSEVFYGDPGRSLNSEKIWISLPAALSVQFDYHIRRQWFVQSVAMVPLRTAKAYIYRPAQLAVIPRFESRFMEFSLPVSLYDYRRLHIGASARLWFLTIGSDNLLGLMGITDFTGMDLYVSIKFNFLKGKCRKQKWPCEARGGSYR